MYTEVVNALDSTRIAITSMSIKTVIIHRYLQTFFSCGIYCVRPFHIFFTRLHLSRCLLYVLDHVLQFCY